jgi:hypothetical protein
MHPAFASVNAKWSHGLTRWNELMASLEAWSHPVKVEMAQGDFGDGGRTIGAVARLTEAPPLMLWAVIAAEAVQSFRDALDHAVYAIACVHHQADPPPSDHLLSFPITPELSKWKDPSKKLSKILPAAVLADIEASQPWNIATPALLWLATLSNKAKHRSLHLLTLARPKTYAETTIPAGIEGFAIWLSDTTPITVDEWLPVGGFRANEPFAEEIIVNVGVEISYAFQDLDANGKAVGETMQDVVTEVGRNLEVLYAAMLKLLPPATTTT